MALAGRQASTRKSSGSGAAGAMRPALFDATTLVRLPEVFRPQTMGSGRLCVVSEVPSEALGRL